MHFGNTNLLWMFWLLGLLLILLGLSEFDRRRKISQFLDWKFFIRLFPDFSKAKRVIKISLTSLSLLFLTLSLLRPQWGFELKEVKRRGIDLFILVDTSDSMRAEDLKPSRMERAKRKLTDLIGYLSGDRIGLIPFAGKAFVACPLTSDAEAFGLFVDELDTDMIPLQGTNVSMGIEKALASFPQEANRNRAIILITDGEDNSGEIDQALENAKKAQVRIYVMGLGTSEGAPIPLKDGNGFKTDKNGQMVLSKLNERQLQKIALDTGGIYVRSVTTDRDIEEIYLKGIKQVLEASEIKSDKKKIPLERFQFPLSLAIFLLLIEPFVFETKRKRRLWFILFLFFFIPFYPQSVFAFSFWDREKGNEHYQKEEYPKAQEKYEQALQDDPEDPILHYNLGDAYYRQEKYAEADKHYVEALNSQDPTLREFSLYNLGNSAYRQNRLEEAIDYYDKTLALNPANEKAQKNKEFVAQKLKEQKEQQQKEEQQQNQEQQKDEQQQQNQEQQNQEQNQDQEQKQQEQQQQNQNSEQNEREGEASNKNDGEKEGDQLKQKPVPFNKDQMGRWLDSLEDNPKKALKEMMKRESGPSRSVEEDW